MRWIFWDVDFDTIDVDAHAHGVMARVLERGRLEDVRWLIEVYGLDRIHAFFRDVWSPEISERTRTFWRAVFSAKEEQWAEPPAWRRSNSPLWIE
jgi:hypothetical protein